MTCKSTIVTCLFRNKSNILKAARHSGDSDVTNTWNTEQPRRRFAIYKRFRDSRSSRKMSTIVCFAVIAIAVVAEGLECWTCISNRGIEHCDVTGYYQTCRHGEDSCETMVWRSGSNYHVIKQCKQRLACANNQLQNTKSSGVSTQCNNDQPNSMCTCCCHDDRCNVGDVTCTQDQTCPPQNQMPHGHITCTDRNQPGSHCTFECTDHEYDVYPAGKNRNHCLSNGSWSESPPCCARPCPPYFLADIVTLYHSSNIHAYEHMVRIAFLSAEQTAIAGDAVKYAGLYYSGEVNMESIVHFNEYNDDKLTMQGLFMQRVIMNNTADRKVNTGAAMEFARTHMFNQSNGVRGEVPRILMVITDENSTDDVLEPAEKLRAEGVLTYAIGLAEDGKILDRDQLMQIAGEDDHLFNPDHDISQVGVGLINEFTVHICADPCVHALHNHEHFAR
nr:matrilin-2 [Ciona intestinalis]|eukprot:XP_009862474.1 matrilin-2 [Ciona intestinalis]